MNTKYERTPTGLNSEITAQKYLSNLLSVEAKPICYGKE